MGRYFIVVFMLFIGTMLIVIAMKGTWSQVWTAITAKASGPLLPVTNVPATAVGSGSPQSITHGRLP